MAQGGVDPHARRKDPDRWHAPRPGRARRAQPPAGAPAWPTPGGRRRWSWPATVCPEAASATTSPHRHRHRRRVHGHAVHPHLRDRRVHRRRAGDGPAPAGQLAMSGGTNQAFVLTADDDLNMRLLDALEPDPRRRPGLRVPDPRHARASLDFGKVNVRHTSAARPREHPLRRAMDRCDPTRGGWYYDVPPSRARPAGSSSAPPPAPASRPSSPPRSSWSSAAPPRSSTIDSGTLTGVPHPPALWLRRAKPDSANAIQRRQTLTLFTLSRFRDASRRG